MQIKCVRLVYLLAWFQTVLTSCVQVSILTGKLGAAERMTSEVLRDLLGVKADMTNVAVCHKKISSSWLKFFIFQSSDIDDVTMSNDSLF